MSECLSTVFAYYGGDWIFSIEHNDVVYFDVDDHRYNDGRDYDGANDNRGHGSDACNGNASSCVNERKNAWDRFARCVTCDWLQSQYQSLWDNINEIRKSSTTEAQISNGNFLFSVT